jgi:hypothetical protein
MIKYGYEFPDDPSEEETQKETTETPKKKPTKESKHDLRNDDN